ncbi:MAG: azurin [Aeromonas sp.]
MKKAITLLFMSSLAGPVLADECALVIEGNDAMQFNVQAMSVPATCKEVTVTLNHTGKLPVNVMGHNWVLANTADYQTVATAGMSAGAENGYLPKDDPRVLAHTQMLGGGQSSSVTFKTDGLAGKDLTFFCSFPGHVAIMKGTFKVG